MVGRSRPPRRRGRPHLCLPRGFRRRSGRRAAGAVAGSVAFAGVVVCGWALATRVFPASLGGELLLTSRLGAPFGYWNALGGMAALTVPPTLWLATRRGAS